MNPLASGDLFWWRFVRTANSRVNRALVLSLELRRPATNGLTMLKVAFV
jgi:hypothetical protein